MRYGVPFWRLQECPQLPMTAARDQLHPTISKTRNQFDSNVTWVRIPPSAPKAAPCGVLLIIFAANYARVARWDSNSPCPTLCVPPGCNRPADCCKGAGESHRLRQKQHLAGCCLLFLRQTMQGLQGRGRIRASAPSITTQFHIG